MATKVPARQSEFLAYCSNFKELTTATPTLYGLDAAQAAAFAVVYTSFATALQTATDPGTRTPAAVQAKNSAREALTTSLQSLSRIIQAAPEVTDEQRVLLGLTVRKTEPTPVPVPTAEPVVEVVDRIGTNVTVRLHDGSATRRGKPDGVAGASLFSYIGAAPPADVAAWKFEGNVTRTTVEIDFPVGTAPGTVVWITAFWFNPRGQSGPGCAPISAIIAGGAMSQAA